MSEPDLDELVKNYVMEINEILENPEQIDDFMDLILGITRCQYFGDNGWETIYYELERTTGGPLVNIIVEPNMIKIELAWMGERKVHTIIMKKGNPLWEFLTEAFS